MNNIFVYCEIEGGKVADVSLELLTKGRALADTLGCELEALALGQGLAGVEKQLAEYGADVARCRMLRSSAVFSRRNSLRSRCSEPRR